MAHCDQATAKHNIPHRFQPYKPQNKGLLSIFKADVKIICGVCKSSSRQGWHRCQDCDFIAHSSCVANCKPNCGMTPHLEQMMSSYTIAPISIPNATFKRHSYKPKTFVTPTDCVICHLQIWGDNKSGVKCFGCSSCAHKSCYDAVVTDESVKNDPHLWKCDLVEMMKDYLSPTQSMHGANALTVEEMDFSSRRNSEVQSGGGGGDLGKQTMGSVGTTVNTLGKVRRTFMENGTMTDTLMRVQRQKYQHPEPQNIAPTVVQHPEIDAGTLQGPFHRRIHQFRGHQFRASYLQATRTQDNNIVKVFQCQQCNEDLADDGRQCYQCKLCDYYCHKKCYTLTSPCSVSVQSLTVSTSDDELLKEREVAAKQVGHIHYRNSKLVNALHWAEDFKNELVKSDAVMATLDDYKITDETIGSGQYGIVKKGQYKHLPTMQVAVKIIDKRKLWNPSVRRTQQDINIPTVLKRELDILQKLDHPNIIRMHNFFDTEKHTYIVMDLASKGDLLDYIMKRQKVTEAECRSVIAYQVLQALKYLHDRGVVHRDLKPENLLLSTGERGNMVIKLADFGFATIFDTVSNAQNGDIASMHHKSVMMMQSVVGTQAYMAPEIVDQRVWKYCAEDGVPTPRKGYDKSVDMWSLGVILYVCLGGVFPFDSQQPILDQILAGSFFFPDEHFAEVSDESVDLICNLLVVNPRKRFNCRRCLSHIWFQNENN